MPSGYLITELYTDTFLATVDSLRNKSSDRGGDFGGRIIDQAFLIGGEQAVCFIGLEISTIRDDDFGGATVIKEEVTVFDEGRSREGGGVGGAQSGRRKDEDDDIPQWR
ncbi:hypothetical protein Nepgr_025426 [Nepenthes gracilis]|uniref:Uncharacterized protein n=1 Tax=Nepenthes gracilis TaxID=150966 RepID=A0AAD3T4Q9_NEPGR|nr:hypothetical protein Nepgr_025426 [Nepenthes gracilis]